MSLTKASKYRLEHVDPRLVRVVEAAAESKAIRFIVTEGVRSPERQRELYADGKSRTLNSKHLPDARGLSRAVDLAILDEHGICRWDFESYRVLAAIMRACARDAGVEITWGGEWTGLRDGPHFELKDAA